LFFMSVPPPDLPTAMLPGLPALVKGRLGLIPNLFGKAPKLAQELWQFAQSAYLDSPLPSLFKERLFVHLSRFCPARYCQVRHAGFLLGHGYPAGDATAPPHTVAQVVALLSWPLPTAGRLRAGLARLAAHAQPAPELPAPESEAEADLFDALAVLFVEPNTSAPVRPAVQQAAGEEAFDRLVGLLAFIRTAHYCISTHPDMPCEPDMVAVLAQHPALADLLLGPSEAERRQDTETLRRTLAELTGPGRGGAAPVLPAPPRPAATVAPPPPGAEMYFEAVANLGPDLLWRNDARGGTDWYNQRWLTYTGLTMPESVDYGWLGALHPDDRAQSLHNFRAALDERRPLRQEHRIRSAAGEYRWFLAQARPVYDAQGEIEGWFGAATDIHERKLAKLERTMSLRLLEQSEQVAEMGNWQYEVATGALRWSAGMYRVFGLVPGAPVGPEIYLSCVVPDDQPLAERIIGYLREGAAGFEHTLRIRAGEAVKTLRTKALMTYNEQGWPVRILGVDLDISTVQRLEQENLHLRLSQQHERLVAVLEAQEEERRRMAESLHNGLGQLLYAAKLQVEQLTAAPEVAAVPALAPARREATRLLKAAIRQARTMSHELTPGIVADFGLEAALHEICRSLKSPQLRWQCLVHLDAEYPVPLPLQVAVYRLAQEVTQNIVKHARATTAALEVETLPGWLVLRAEDNGQGFEPTAYTTGIGLKTLRNRVDLLGGTVLLHSTPGRGTQLQLRIPLVTPLLP
jgi:PAS domain S-box-containing protein